MNQRTVFISVHSYEDAKFRAKVQGYIPTGEQFMNKRGEYVIVANKGGWM